MQRLLDAVLGRGSTGGSTNGSFSWRFDVAFAVSGQFYDANLWFFAYSFFVTIGGLSAIIVVFRPTLGMPLIDAAHRD